MRGGPTAVLGAGNGGMALAGDLALQGLAVRLYEHPDYTEGFAPVLTRGMIDVRDGGDGPVRPSALALATHDLAAAIEGAAIVNLIVPVSAQLRFFDALLPLLAPEQTVIVWAGRCGGLRLGQLRKERAGSFGVVEANTLPYGTRRTGPTEVSIFFRALKAFAAPVAGAGADAAIAAAQAWFPVLARLASPVEVMLRNSGTVVLGVGAMLNVGAIEAAEGKFALFRDGMTPAVRGAIRTVHHELIALGAALGFAIPPYPEEVYASPTSIEGANFRDAKGGTDGFFRLTGPDRLHHRYTIENIRYGLAVAAALGRRHGVPMPLCATLVTLADQLLGPDFARQGWTLAELGLD